MENQCVFISALNKVNLEEFKKKVFDEGLRLDVLVEELIICELKAVDEMNPVWKARTLSQFSIYFSGLTGIPFRWTS